MVTSLKDAVKNGVKAIDTHYPPQPRCTVISEQERSASVVYDDEPDCVVHTCNFPGRFERLA
jgi:hypothetical protein